MEHDSGSLGRGVGDTKEEERARVGAGRSEK